MKTYKCILTIIGFFICSISYSQWIPGTPGSTYLDPNNYNKVGIGTSNPQAPLHVVGDGVANAQGWNKAIILDKNAALIWKGSTNSYFMAHPSNNPVGVEISKY